MNDLWFTAAVTTPVMVLATGLVVFLIGYYSDRPHKPDAAE